MEKIISFMSMNQDFTKGSTKSEDHQILAWENLTVELNAMGPPQHSSKEWRTVWSRFKGNKKRKSNVIESDVLSESTTDTTTSMTYSIPNVADMIYSVTDTFTNVTDMFTSVTDTFTSDTDMFTSVAGTITSVTDSIPSMTYSMPSVTDSIPSMTDSIPSVANTIPLQYRSDALVIELLNKIVDNTSRILAALKDLKDIFAAKSVSSE